MLLVTATLLTLTAGIDVVLQPTITATMQIIPQSVVNKIDVIAEDANRHHAFDGCGVPITVRERSKVVKHRKKYALEKVHCRLNLCRTPASTCMSNQLGRIYQFESTQGST